MNDMKFTTAGEYMGDESHLPVAEQSLVFRLRKRAEIRRQIKDRKSVQEGAADRIADLLKKLLVRSKLCANCDTNSWVW